MTPPAAAAGAVAAPAPAINPRLTVSPRRSPATPRRPRRISGPAGNPARGRAGSIGARTRGGEGRSAHAVGLAEAVATHRLLDRLIRGRLWIGVIAFALIGIVTMQLGLLKLNAGIGQSLAREALLQRENATLSTENSEMAAGERVEAQAEHAGMELIPAGALSFLAAHPSSDVRKAAAALSASATTTTTPVTTATTSESAGSEVATTTGASAETEAATSASTSAAGATPETTGQSGTAPEAATTLASTPTETAESASSTATSAAASTSGAAEAASPSTSPSPSASTSTGGGTIGG
jgi:hypothetical protein